MTTREPRGRRGLDRLLQSLAEQDGAALEILREAARSSATWK